MVTTTTATTVELEVDKVEEDFSKLKIRQWEVQWFGVDSDGDV